MRSDQSFAISGLLDQQTTDIMSKTPGAANIPILGALFKSKNVNHSTTELVVIVTPTLVDPLTETGEPAQPDLPIPTLNPGKFDKSLGKDPVSYTHLGQRAHQRRLITTRLAHTSFATKAQLQASASTGNAPGK